MSQTNVISNSITPSLAISTCRPHNISIRHPQSVNEQLDVRIDQLLIKESVLGGVKRHEPAVSGIVVCCYSVSATARGRHYTVATIVTSHRAPSDANFESLGLLIPRKCPAKERLSSRRCAWRRPGRDTGIRRADVSSR